MHTPGKFIARTCFLFRFVNFSKKKPSQLFVMLKVFRIPAGNPIVWQLSLVDSEIEKLIYGRLQSAPRRAPEAEVTEQEPVEKKECKLVPQKELAEDDIW
jgi:hypothetical protein